MTEKSKTLLDVILSSHVERFATSGNLSLGISDHDLIYTIRKCKLPRPKPRTIEYRSFKHFKEEDFIIAALQNVPWHTAYLYEDSDDIWEHWSKVYNDVLELYAPLKKKQIRSNQLPW